MHSAPVIAAYSVEAASTPDLQSLITAPVNIEILASIHLQSGDPLCEFFSLNEVSQSIMLKASYADGFPKILLHIMTILLRIG